MLSHVHFVTVVLWLSVGVAGLLWTMACALTANKMEQEGATFWKAFVTCFLLTPLVGLLAIAAARATRSDRPLVQNVLRS